jgi:hypothetical protein
MAGLFRENIAALVAQAQQIFTDVHILYQDMVEE